MKNFNFGFIFVLILLIPEMLKAVAESVEAAQASNKPGPEREKEAVEALVAWYEVARKAFPALPVSLDAPFRDSLAPGLIKFMYRGFRDTEREGLDAEVLGLEGGQLNAANQ